MQVQKNFLVDYINNLLKDIDTYSLDYYEPFLGSGAIFYNLNKEFNHYYINDIDSNIVDLHSCFCLSYNYYEDMLKFVLDNYGDIKHDKKAYYMLRDSYNNDTNIYSKRIKLLMLANSCINSMLRFGPNGMNQSFGNRHYIIDKESWKIIQSKLTKSSLTNTDYLECLNSIKRTSVIFVDPPYVKNIMTYSSKQYNRQTLVDKLISLSLDNHIIFYTDEDNEDSDYLLDYGFRKTYIRMMKNIGPNNHSEETSSEVLYYKIFNK